jgi:hypothetical protein
MRKMSQGLMTTIKRGEKTLQLVISNLYEIIKKIQKRLRKTIIANYSPN